MATDDPQKCESGVETSFSRRGNLCTLEVRIGKEPAGVAGNQPLAFLFPKRIGGPLTLVSGQQYAPLRADDFLLLTKPNYEAGSRYKAEFGVAPQAAPGKRRNKDR